MGHSGPWSGRSVSEWAPQPWSRETTLPSSAAHSLAHTPKMARRAPAMGRKKPQVEQVAWAFRTPSASGP